MSVDWLGPWLNRAVPAVLLALLGLLAYLVLQPFLIPTLWAAIVATMTWPAYQRVCRGVRRDNWFSALLMVIALTALVVLPLWWLGALLRLELTTAYKTVASYLTTGPHPLPDAITRIPWLGERLQEWLNQYAGNPDLLREQAGQWIEESLGDIRGIVGSAGYNALKLGVAVVTLFFLYRDGPSLLRQLRVVLQRYLGNRLADYLDAIATTTKAVVFGLIATALAQGLIAGAGYWFAGVAAPASFGAVTALAALIPFGAPLVWGPLGLSLIASGQTTAGVGLLLWGLFAVSWIDNIVRPLVISSATHIPFLLVLFGVIGGVAAFGLIGLFLGPVILAVLLAVWREWVEAQTDR